VEEIIFEQNSQSLFFIYLLSGLVGASISVYVFKISRLFSSSYLFGLVMGFALISFGDFFFSVTVNFANKSDSFNILHWIQLSITSFGYAFLALVYYFQKSTEKKFSLIIKSILLSLTPIISLLLFVIVTENIEIPLFQQYNEYFRIVNIISIGYVMFRTFNNSEIKNRKNLILIPLGFAILLLSQFIRFLFAIDPMFFTLELSGILKITALTIILFTLTQNWERTENLKSKHD